MEPTRWPIRLAPTGDRTETKPKSGSARYTLQISSFQDRTQADAFAASLTAAGYPAYVTTSEVPDKGTFYRVRLGKYGDYDAAVAGKDAFEKKVGKIAYVTKL